MGVERSEAQYLLPIQKNNMFRFGFDPDALRPKWELELMDICTKLNLSIKAEEKLTKFVAKTLMKQDVEHKDELKQKDEEHTTELLEQLGNYSEGVDELKQQYREELIKLNEWIESESGKSGRKEIMEQVNKLLNSKKEE